MLSLTLANRLSEIERLASQIQAFGTEHHLSEEVVFAFTLALDEIVTNVISHGYAGTDGCTVRVRLWLEGQMLRAEVEDDARPFNPLEVPPPDLDAPIAERPIGGLGLHLARAMMDGIEYRREDGHNVLTLVKSLS